MRRGDSTSQFQTNLPSQSSDVEPVMTELNEVALRILSELEEAGAENISSTMNTVLKVTGTPDDIEVFQEALTSLIRAGDVSIGYATGPSGRIMPVSTEEGEATTQALSRLVNYDARQTNWIWEKTKPRAEILVTPEGLAKAREILDERGYQWWRERK